MDIKRKLEIVEQSIKSISTHRDEDSTVVKAALDRIARIAEDAKQAIDAEVASRIEQTLQG
jgi:hypothetical protein